MIRFLVFFSILGLALCDFKLLVLHINDAHARLLPTDRYAGPCEVAPTECFGGMARVKKVADMKKHEAAAKGRETIFLNAGDNFSGSPFYTLYRWPIISKIINKMDFDAMALGSHEFDGGVSGLMAYIATVTTPQVCANINLSNVSGKVSRGLQRSVVLERKGVKIGIIGYLTPRTTEMSKTGDAEFTEEVTAIRAECKILKAQGVNILIALGQSGYKWDLEMAKQLEDIDLVVGGHSHTFLYTADAPGQKNPLDQEVPQGPYPTVVPQPSGKKVLVVQAYYATKYLGYLELDFDDEGIIKSSSGSPILLSGDMPEDPEIAGIVRPYGEELNKTIRKVVGRSKEILLDNNHHQCRLAECSLGNLITDAFVEYVRDVFPKTKEGNLKAPMIAIIQAGEISGSIDARNNKGDITIEDIMTLLPWNWRLQVNTITGQALVSTLEYAVSKYEETMIGQITQFLQVSGLRVTYKMSEPTGKRVVSAMAVCSDCPEPRYEPIELSKNYRVVMSEQIARGGDGFNMLMSIEDPTLLDEVDYKVVLKYVKNHSPIDPHVEQRITVLGAEEALMKASADLQQMLHVEVKGHAVKEKNPANNSILIVVFIAVFIAIILLLLKQTFK